MQLNSMDSRLRVEHYSSHMVIGLHALINSFSSLIDKVTSVTWQDNHSNTVLLSVSVKRGKARER